MRAVTHRLHLKGGGTREGDKEGDKGGGQGRGTREGDKGGGQGRGTREGDKGGGQGRGTREGDKGGGQGRGTREGDPSWWWRTRAMVLSHNSRTPPLSPSLVPKRPPTWTVAQGKWFGRIGSGLCRESRAGPGGPRVIPVLPATCTLRAPADCMRVVLLRRLRLPRHCRCGGALDEPGTTGQPALWQVRWDQQCCFLPCVAAAARICREGGNRSAREAGGFRTPRREVSTSYCHGEASKPANQKLGSELRAARSSGAPGGSPRP